VKSPESGYACGHGYLLLPIAAGGAASCGYRLVTRPPWRSPAPLGARPRGAGSPKTSCRVWTFRPFWTRLGSACDGGVSWRAIVLSRCAGSATRLGAESVEPLLIEEHLPGSTPVFAPRSANTPSERPLCSCCPVQRAGPGKDTPTRAPARRNRTLFRNASKPAGKSTSCTKLFRFAARRGRDLRDSCGTRNERAPGREGVTVDTRSPHRPRLDMVGRGKTMKAGNVT
jgi:hypothetical protein